MIIYAPYFYIIQDIRNGIYYAGAKWAKDSNPKNFMTEDGYQTSSKTIHNIIYTDGLSSFRVVRLRIFDCPEYTRNYETRFLLKVDAANNENFYNRHNNDTILFSYHDPNYKKIMLKKYGVEHPCHSDEIKERMYETNMDRYGAKNVFCKDSNIREKIDDAFLERYGTRTLLNIPGVKDKVIQTNMDNYGVPWFPMSDEYKNKMTVINEEKSNEEKQSAVIKSKLTKLEKYGDENYSNRPKAIKTNKEKYGVENVSQVPEIAQRRGKSISKTKSDAEWKETKGKEASEKLSLTLNSEEWKRTKGKVKSEKISKQAKKKIGVKNPNYGNRWSDEKKKALSAQRKGKVCITDGVTNKMINPSSDTIPDGWKRGKTKNPL